MYCIDRRRHVLQWARYCVCIPWTGIRAIISRNGLILVWLLHQKRAIFKVSNLSCNKSRLDYRILRKNRTVFSAASLSGAFSGLLAAAIENMDGLCGKAGWAWIFILVRPQRRAFYQLEVTEDSLNTHVNAGGCAHYRSWLTQFFHSSVYPE